jgi:hypothetical protein
MKFYHFQDVSLLKYYGFEVYFCVYLKVYQIVSRL